ncbi:plasmid mobilization protein [Escherichia coli]|uniref:plasmid mobilization protein n=1 Tax=Escherichia coli TaxID=562 RepID=UPI003B7C7F95
MKKNRDLHIRLNDADYEKIQSIASKSNRTVSELIRDHIGKITVKDSELDRVRNINLNRINANLNMIAKWVNTHKELADALKVIELLITIEREVKSL